MTPVRVSRSKVFPSTIVSLYKSPSNMTVKVAPGSYILGASARASQMRRSFAPSVNAAFITSSRRMTRPSSVSRTSEPTASSVPSAVVTATATRRSGRLSAVPVTSAYRPRTVW